MTNHVAGTVAAGGRAAAHKLDVIGWGLFFLWIGIAMLANLGWGMALLGIGIIMLGMQVVRSFVALGIETFWLLVGAFFVIAGVWELLSVRAGLIPVVCIVAGGALLVSALFGKLSE